MSQSKQTFDFEAALQALREGQDIHGKNGHITKRVKALSGEFGLDTPRDHTGTFKSQLIGKHQRHLTDELERKIFSLLALGMSYQAIREHVQEMVAMTLPNGTLNAITDKLPLELKS